VHKKKKKKQTGYVSQYHKRALVHNPELSGIKEYLTEHIGCKVMVKYPYEQPFR